MRLVLEISGTHDELSLYQSEIQNLFAAHGVPDSYSIHVDKSAGKKRPAPVEATVADVTEEVEASVPMIKVPRTEPVKGGKKGKGEGKGVKGKGKGKGAKGKGKGKGKGKAAKETSDEAQPRYNGVIRKWNDKKNYFFVDCEALFPHFQCDVVVQKEELPAGATVGTPITFIAMESPELRNPVAQEVLLA